MIPANSTSAGFFVTGLSPGPVMILGFNPSFPLLFANDILHGYRTIFPIPLGEASSFDPESWALSAREARAIT